jgi:hypothetical protein
LTVSKQRVFIYHTLDHAEAKRRIQEFIDNNPGAKTSAIIDTLRIDPEQAVDILDELETENSIYSSEIGSGPHRR